MGYGYKYDIWALQFPRKLPKYKQANAHPVSDDLKQNLFLRTHQSLRDPTIKLVPSKEINFPGRGARCLFRLNRSNFIIF